MASRKDFYDKVSSLVKRYPNLSIGPIKWPKGNCQYWRNRYAELMMELGQIPSNLPPCPMTEEEFNAFYDELVAAEVAPLKEFEKEKLEYQQALKDVEAGIVLELDEDYWKNIDKYIEK